MIAKFEFKKQYTVAYGGKNTQLWQLKLSSTRLVSVFTKQNRNQPMANIMNFANTKKTNESKTENNIHF